MISLLSFYPQNPRSNSNPIPTNPHHPRIANPPRSPLTTPTPQTPHQPQIIPSLLSSNHPRPKSPDRKHHARPQPGPRTRGVRTHNGALLVRLHQATLPSQGADRKLPGTDRDVVRQRLLAVRRARRPRGGGGGGGGQEKAGGPEGSFGGDG